MEKDYKTLKELGIPTFHPTSLDWRKSTLSEVKSGELVGLKFKTTNGKEFVCEKIDKGYVYFHNIKMNRKYALFLLLTSKQLTTQEQKDFIANKYPNSKLHIPKHGCQLHGDKDATLTLEDGTVYTIPWNY